MPAETRYDKTSPSAPVRTTSGSASVVAGADAGTIDETAIAAMLLDGDTRVLAVLKRAGISSTDFVDPLCRQIVATAASLVAEGAPLSMLTIARSGNIEQPAMQRLYDSAGAVVPAHAGWHATELAKIVATRRARCQLLDGLKRLEAGDDAGGVLREIGEAGRATASSAWAESGVNAAELLQRDFAEVEFLLAGLLPVGLTLFAAKRKRGKSWLALLLAEAVSAEAGIAFGRYPVARPGRVLYLALEDNMRRLQRRIRQIGDAPSDRLHLFTEWPRIGAGFEERADEWLRAYPDTVLIIVDVLQKVRPPTARNTDPYAADYAVMEPLHRLAHGHNIAILVIHHCRKADADDVFDGVSGTGGLTGAADTIWLLKRDAIAREGTLWITGRDIEETELALTFDPSRGLWTVEGNADEARMSDSRRAIVALLRTENAPMRPADIARALGRNESTTRSVLMRMRDSGDLVRDGERYKTP